MAVIERLIAQSEVLNLRINTLLPSSALLRITRTPNPPSTPVPTIPILPETPVTPTGDLHDLLAARCSPDSAAMSTNTLALTAFGIVSKGFSASEYTLSRRSAQPYGEPMPSCEYDKIFVEGEETLKFSELVSRTMPPLRNIYSEALQRVESQITSVDNNISTVVDLRMTGLECKLLEFEHLICILKSQSKECNITGTASAVRAVETMMKRKKRTTRASLPDYTPPTIVNSMTVDQQFLVIVDSLQKHKMLLLRTLKENYNIVYDGPYLKETLFWDVVREVIAVSAEEGTELAELRDASDKELVKRHCRLIIKNNMKFK